MCTKPAWAVEAPNPKLVKKLALDMGLGVILKSNWHFASLSAVLRENKFVGTFSMQTEGNQEETWVNDAGAGGHTWLYT